ncbi:MAG: circadian clock protein KaiC [Methylotenera sp.]|nr:MAG: circadian clock protein KaiC [Methylotenera sp.]
MDDQKTQQKIAKTGIEGLNHILKGGLPAGRFYLLEGAPGSGKTTMAMQFLMEGMVHGETVLYVTLSETSEELAAVAESHQWAFGNMHLFELAQADIALSFDREQSILHPWEVELSQTIKLITDKVDAIKPTRVVFDSLSEMRLLAQDTLRYRRQLLMLKQHFAKRGITVLLVDDMTGNPRGGSDSHLHSLCHGVITLERKTLDFGGARRKLQIQKLRGVNFIAGYHDFVIKQGGIVVYARLVASEHHTHFDGKHVPSGLKELDEMLHGGIQKGTTTLITGPAGCGKTNISLQYVSTACERGERVVIYQFDERIGTLLSRSRLLGFDFKKFMDVGLLSVHQMDPAEISPGEFAWMMKDEVEQKNAKLIVIDSLSGYTASMPQEKELLLQMHEMLTYLNQQGVATLMINPQQSLVGTMSTGGLNVSYVADTVMLLRFFESEGRIRKAISIIKNRGGSHEDTIRELRIDSQGLRIGNVLNQFQGVLTGVPEYKGSSDQLLEPRFT